MKTFSKVKLADLLEMYPAVWPDFIPENGSTFYITGLPMKTKRLTQKAQTENIIAAHKAHAVQQAELIHRLQKSNADLMTAHKELAAQFDGAAKVHAEQAASIAMFKQEALQAAVTIAELRGYIGRTLEDDAVREADSKPGQVFDSVVHTTHAPSNANGFVQPLRSGPSAMHPVPIMGNGCAIPSSSDDWRNYHGQVQAAPKEPLHWLAR